MEGAKGVGKTATGTERAASVIALDNPAQREIVSADLDHITQVRGPVLLDEWQRLDGLLDRVRRAVDIDSIGGQFLLAGSADMLPSTRIHSGTGRIVSLKMRPLSLAERGRIEPTVSLAELLTGSRPTIGGQSTVDLSTYTDEILSPGFPGIRTLPNRARNKQLDGYITRIVERDLRENGLTLRRPETVRTWLAAYGAATATDTSYTKILDAATTGDSAKPARATVDNYRDHLIRLFALDPLPAWIPAFNPLK